MFDSLLRPKTIAVIGASRSPDKHGYSLLRNLVNGGFTGTIVPVNPHSDEILGLTCVRSVLDYRGNIDLAVVAVPAPQVRDAVRAVLRKGAKAVVVISVGFKESGAEGAALEGELARICATARARLLGPNCLGFIHNAASINLTFAGPQPLPGGISVISQSAAIATSIMDWAWFRQIGLNQLISIGNKADLNEVHFLEEMAQDPNTRVVVAYLESIERGDDFVKAAEAASSVKPVIVLKVGTSISGERAATSHTGNLAGRDIAYGAAFRRAGVIRAESFEALMDAAKAFSMQPLPRGNRVAVITNAGGPGIMAADALEGRGMHVVSFGSGACDHGGGNIALAGWEGNPIRVMGDSSPDQYEEAIQQALADDSVDSVLVSLVPRLVRSADEVAKVVARSRHPEKPVVASIMGGSTELPRPRQLVEWGLTDFPGPVRAAEVLRCMNEYTAWKRRPPRIVTRFPVNRRRVERIITRYQRADRTQVNEVDGKAILKAFDFAIPEGRVATNAEEAVECATRIGFPVALKVVSTDIIHKTDVGGVRLDLGTPAAVRDAYDLMTLRLPELAPGARIEGVLVERMITQGLEVVLGMTRDPQFGPMLMFGMGGIFVEVMKDVTFHLAPITAEEAMQMLAGTRSFTVLKGARGRSGADLEAIAAGLQHISQLCTDFPQIVELDLNPYIVGEPGTDPMAADVRMTLAREGSVHGQ